MVIDIGRVCIKLRGREAGRYCVVVDVIDNNFVIIDGDLKRKRVNINHLEPLPLLLNIKKGDSTENVIKAMLENKIPISYWKLKKENLLTEDIINLYKSKFGDNWEKIAKKIKAPGKK